MIELFVASLTLIIWLYLVLARGAFWRGRERDDWELRAPAVWPRVAAVIPARNEADCIVRSMRSLLQQDYAGPLSVYLVDDNSDDGTALVAQAAASGVQTKHALTIVTGKPLPGGWTGKLWAAKQGIDAAEAGADAPNYLLLTDADIVHEPDSVRRLVAHAEGRGLVLMSLMAKLRCESLAERIHVPAFIFFFQMLYPFAWVNRPGKAMAAAAGGCMLVRADALRRAGGIDVIRNALIDDCSLAKVLKGQGPIWLALTDRVRSIRCYPEFEDIRRMVSRSAYAQLRYSPLLLAGTTLGMALTYLAPPFLAFFSSGAARLMGIVAWALMAMAFLPTLRFYRMSPLWGIAMPVIALFYMFYTLDSAYQHARGRGGAWKGRVQANASKP